MRTVFFLLFSVSLLGFEPLSYQWMRNGQNISSANSSSYTTPSLSLSDSGAQYSVLVWNRFPPAVISSIATLTVSNRSRPLIRNLTVETVEGDLTYAGGETVRFSASAMDEVDGEMVSAAFSWTVVFHHQTHTHPFLVRDEKMKKRGRRRPRRTQKQ